MSSMIYSRDIPFWSETLESCTRDQENIFLADVVRRLPESKQSVLHQPLTYFDHARQLLVEWDQLKFKSDLTFLFVQVKQCLGSQLDREVSDAWKLFQPIRRIPIKLIYNHISLFVR